MKKIGASLAPDARPASAMEESPPSHHPQRAVRGWRVILDKLITILAFSSLQEAVEEWFPQSLPSPVCSSAQQEEKLEDVYAELIIGAKVLPPLKTKTEPRQAASSCVHPKKSLRGGGNKTQSYIACMECNTRWENTYPAVQLKKDLKENNRKQKGLLGQATETDEAMEEVAMTHTEDGKVVDLCRQLKEEKQRSSRLREEFNKELEAQRIATREMEIKMEARINAVMAETEERLRMSTASASQNIYPAPRESTLGSMPNQLPTRPMSTPLCRCQQASERLVVKKEGPRKGRTFFKCMQRACDFFEWAPLENGTIPDSWSVVGSEMAASSQPTHTANSRPAQVPASQASRRRSKSPRRKFEETAGQEVQSISD